MIRKFILILIVGSNLLLPQFSSAKEWDPQLLQASHLIYEGRPEQAENLINTYIENHPEDPNGLFVKVVALEWKAALTEESEQNLNQETFRLYKEANQIAFHRWRHDPENVDRLIDLGNSYIFLARKYGDRGSWFDAALTGKKCQRHLEKALKLDPSRVDALLALGGFHYFAAGAHPELATLKKIFGVRGTREQGLAELKRAAAEKHLYQFDTQYSLMHIYMDYEKNQEEALNILKLLEKKFPENPEIGYKRPVIYEKQDPKKGAKGYLSFAHWCEKKKEKCSPHFLFLAYYHAGKIFKEMGEKTKAKEYLTRALLHDSKSDPNLTAEALKLKNEIELKENRQN